jgi:hypothetical protein
MPRTTASIHIPLPIREVYEGSRDVEALLPHLPDARKITSLEKTPTRSITRFEGVVIGKRIVYTEVEDWDDATYFNHFRQTEGDFDKYEGQYLYKEVPEGTEFTIVLDWELNLPLIGPLLNKLLAKVVEHNVVSLTKGVKDVCLEKAAQKTAS